MGDTGAPSRHPIVITGPTASGKTAVALDLARQIGGEIISMDSRQIYRGMDIGTAKPTLAEQAMVPHHGIDIRNPNERYSAGQFARDARQWIAEIEARRRIPILVGGSGFFLRALTHPMFEEPTLDPAKKEELRQYLNGKSREELLAWLERLDPMSAERLATDGGRQRLARAIEVAVLSGRPLSAWHAEQQPAAPLQLDIRLIDVPREELYARIDQRVEQMYENGLVDEVKSLMAAGYDEHSPGLKTVGYIEILRGLGSSVWDAAAVKEAIKRNTRQYARRQMTWFRHQLPAHTQTVRP